MKLQIASNRVVFLTGATGNIGQALLEQLDPAGLICLVHRTSIDHAAVESVRGDIRQPRFGLDVADYRKLARRVDCVVHSAAATEFGPQAEMTRQTNVDGTRHVVEFAEAAGAPFYHISTAFVRESTSKRRRPHAYESSKRSAEKLVRERAIPHVIFRPSLVVGDTRDGAITRPQAFHLLLRIWLKGRLPAIPATAAAVIDYVPRDVVARAIATLVARNAPQGEYWPPAGRRAVRMDDFVDLCSQRASRLLGRRINAPRLEPPEVFAESLEGPQASKRPVAQRDLLQRLARGGYMNLVEPFPSSLPFLSGAFGLPRLPDPVDVLMKNLDSWARICGGREPEGRPAVLATCRAQPNIPSGDPDYWRERAG